MDFGKIKYVHLIGIGGIGMSALARYFKKAGKEVSGYDKTESPLTKDLIREGMNIYYTEDLRLLPDPIRENPDSEETLIIYTPAVPKKHAELEYFNSKGVRIYKRAEVLGLISTDLPTIAVAGTHGKTTTTSLLTFLCLGSSQPFVSFVGGINENFKSNLVIRDQPEYMITEADEYDRSFLRLDPKHAILTSMDPDHLDIYGSEEEMIHSFREFCEHVEAGGLLAQNKLGSKLEGIEFETYGLEEGDHRAANIRVDGGITVFDFHSNSFAIKDLLLKLPGLHNLENAVAAIAIALRLGVTADEIRSQLNEYKGVKRRFEYIIQRPDFVYIDDYAHHPGEINAVVNSLRKMYPGKKITGIFQPHLYSRTSDFAEGFADSLSKLDEVILLDIYPAREEPIPGVTSEWLLEQIDNPNKVCCRKEELIEELKSHEPEVLVTLGAGDIDREVDKIKLLYK